MTATTTRACTGAVAISITSPGRKVSVNRVSALPTTVSEPGAGIGSSFCAAIEATAASSPVSSTSPSRPKLTAWRTRGASSSA